MFSKRTSPRSIASQLVLFFTLAATLLLSCGLGVFYWIVVRHAFAEDNAVLADKISALSADFKTGGGPQIFGAELKGHHAGEHAPYWIRILDAEGRTLMRDPRNESRRCHQIFFRRRKHRQRPFKARRISKETTNCFRSLRFARSPVANPTQFRSHKTGPATNKSRENSVLCSSSFWLAAFWPRLRSPSP